jgi:hypothetical protein
VNIENCLMMMKKIFVNVLEHPQESKFRQVMLGLGARQLRPWMANQFQPPVPAGEGNQQRVQKQHIQPEGWRALGDAG